ncbi:MAG: thioredoxin domain-containing protein [Epsilonproteobacteria bacterium]|nr:thioredoxin domain-containing protein [Campylobacterota bacterium]
MSKLLSTALLATVAVSATTQDEIKDYVKHHMVNNPQIEVTSVDIIGKRELEKPAGWSAFFVNIHAEIKRSKTEKDRVTVPDTIFAKDGFAVPTIIDMKTGKDLKSQLKPDLDPNIYDDKHLIAGDKDAKHKLVVFSDPQCPFCKEIVPNMYKIVKEYPKRFALYYYHMPLLRLHPVSDIITRAMLVEQKRKNFDKVIDMYSLKIEANELNVTKVLNRINSEFNLKLTEAEIDSKEIAEELRHDRDVATKAMVSGTPTIFIDGKWDRSKKEYKKYIPNR